MKITAVNTFLVKLPLPQPITTAIHDMRSVGCVCLEIVTDQGLVGEAYCFALNASRIKAFNEMILGFKHLLIGHDPHFVRHIGTSIWQEINPTGFKGLTISALSTIDTALWDLVGKYLQQPLHKVFGASREKVWTYASGGLWFDKTIDQLTQQAQDWVADGFRAIKMRVGHADITVDINRVKEVRHAIGDHIQLLVDANQALTPKQAIRLSRAMEEYGVYWLEEPVSANDLDGHRQVTAASPINIASGETEYSYLGMEAMLKNDACDILMPDLQRVGGLTAMRQTAALALAHHKTFSTHIFTEHSLCIAGAEPNCESVEHMPWFAPLFNEEMSIEDGYIAIPDRPGTGFTFSQATRKQWAYTG